MRVSGGERYKQRDYQCKSPGVGMRLRVWETARKVNFSEQLGGPKPPQQTGLSLEGLYLTGFEGDPSGCHMGNPSYLPH